MKLRIAILTAILPLALLFNAALAQDKSQSQNAPDSDSPARHIVGMPNIRLNAEGLLKLQPNEIEFDYVHGTAEIPISSIDNIFTGAETTEHLGMAGEVAEGASMAAPYDSGAILTLLLREKVDVLTIAFRDPNGGLCAAIFALPKGRAAQMRADLISRGAHAGNSDLSAPGAAAGDPPPNAAGNAPPARAKTKTPPAASSQPAIQVELLDANDIRIPPEFRLAIYEDLVDRLNRSRMFSQVYRSGDRRADKQPYLLTLRLTLEKFKQGNQTERRLTGVLGVTKIKVDAQVSPRNSQPVVDGFVEGKVRAFGENLNATRDVAKRLTKLLSKSFLPRPLQYSDLVHSSRPMVLGQFEVF